MLGDRLTIIPGLRADFVDRQPGPLVPGGAAVSDVAVSPGIAAFYDISVGWSVFGPWARTERLPMIDELYSASATQTAALALSKEKAETFELGLAFGRAGVLAAGDSLQFRLIAFQNTVKNLSKRGPAPVPVMVENLTAASYQNNLDQENGLGRNLKLTVAKSFAW